MKYWFRNDYTFGAPQQVIDAVLKANLEGNTGYGNDKYTEKAKALIKEKCGCPDATVEFTVGGTQTNVMTCSFFLKPWEAVISPASGHLNGHEAGAFEATGHKILQVKTGIDGKLTPELIAPLVSHHKNIHLTEPRLVYISNATENGDVYTKKELTELSNFCHKNNLLLFADGARLGCALTSEKNDLTLKEFAKLVDAFYIGGTKNGALFGEALVVNRKDLDNDFFRMKKHMGAVVEKGWLQGSMFLALLEDDLYFRMARHSNEMAKRLQEGLIKLGLKPWTKSPTNQLFFIVPHELKNKLDSICEYEDWCRYDENHTVVRFVACFSTKEEDVDGFLRELQK